MANLRHCLRFPSLLSFLKFLDILDILGRRISLYIPNLQGNPGVPGIFLSRQVSLYLRPEMHLFAILENSTLRRDCDTFKSNSVGSGYMSHCWTSAFDDHFNHGFVILKNVEHRRKSRKLRVRRHTVNIVQIKIVVLG